MAFKRIFKFAINDLSRNKGISLAAIFILTVAILVISGLFFFQGMVDYMTAQIQNRIDITAYFVEEAGEDEILAIRDEILKMSENIKKVEYVSKEQALASFNEIHKNDVVLIKSLQEVGGNPFSPSLNITTNGEPGQYEQIANVLEASSFSNLIEKVDFMQKKFTIEKVYSITKNINLFGIILEIILIIVSVLVVFNTIKLGIQNSREEIATMKIVGATDWFIRGPFIIQGMIYGIIAFFISFVISAVLAISLSGKIAVMMPGFNMLSFFLTNWWIFVLIQLVFGMAVGAISALVVVKKHLKA